MKTISTDEAEELLDDEVPLIDVRTEEEFSDGHIPGAINIPYKLRQGDKEANPEFVPILTTLFAMDQPLIISCQAGVRSKRACEVLAAEGFSALHDLECGFAGKKDAFGRLIPGWSQEGREIEMDADPEQTYAGARALASERSS